MQARPTSLSRRSWRSVTDAILMSVWLFSLIPNVVNAGESLEEQKLRQEAIFFRNFLSFVQWPDENTETKPAMFQMCLDGNAALGLALSSELRATTVDERKVHVRLVKTERDFKGCEALMVDDLGQTEIAKMLRAVRNSKVLTFGQTEGFLEAGGVVQLSKDERGFQFVINLEAARNTGITLDARLLRLAKRVVR